MSQLDEATIRRALRVLGETLPPDDDFDLVLVGGAALVLLYGARVSTQDVDGFSIGSTNAETLRGAAASVAAELGLRDDWLNDGAKGYVHDIALGEQLMARGPLRVYTLAPQQLLAMKLCAWRDDLDVADAGLLLSKLAGDRASIWDLVERHLVPGRELKAQYAFDDLWESAHGPR